ncbi:hypothetical protein [Arthrobacter flavus]|uniref:Uncharacterized protein n=1 Tax=Arthrobacter flavus TaxID=95172 RepID=A0ABW4Q9B0_9MICC
MSIHSEADLDWVAEELNDPPRRRLEFRKPIELIEGLLLQRPLESADPYIERHGRTGGVSPTRPTIVAGMSEREPTAEKLHPKLEAIRSRAVERGRTVQMVHSTELVVEGERSPGFLAQSVTFLLGLVGMRRAIEAPETQQPYKLVYSMNSNGRVHKEQLWAPHRI